MKSSIENIDSRHEINKIREYEKKGYTTIYTLEGDALKNQSNGKYFHADEVTIEHEERYEGISNPEDMSILYAIQTADGNKGTLLVAYGNGSATDLAMFMKDVEMKRNNEVK